MTDVLAIVGSATPPGRLRRAVGDAVQRAADSVQAQLLDLAEVRIAPADGRPPDALDDDTARVVAAIDRAGAVLLATPVYRGSLTGTLKNLLDHVPVAALQGKPVGIVAMGATDHHFLGAERRRPGAAGRAAARAVTAVSASPRPCRLRSATVRGRRSVAQRA